MSLRLPLVVLFIILSFSSAFGDYIPGQILVRFKSGVVKMPRGLTVASIKAATVTVASVRNLNARYGVTNLRQLYRDALNIRPDWKHLEDDYVLIFPKEKDFLKAVAEYRKDANVISAAANTTVRAFDTTPNDPIFLLQWGLSKISAPAGWDKTTGTTESLIAVLDTGVNYNHEDLSGKVNLTYAKDYVNNDNDPLDDFGHGTAVSGVIGAITNNAKGIAGVDWQAKILPIKVLDSGGGGSIVNVSAAIAYLTALKSSGVKIAVINMSLGQYNDNVRFGADPYAEENPANLKERCQEAHDQGIVLVAAAGNGNVDWNTYPAYYSTVLAVAATDSSDKRSVWTGPDSDTGRTQASNYGSWVDVAAPGSDIVSTLMTGGYSSSPNNWNGTSLASPFVSGLASLVKVLFSHMSTDQIMNQIKTMTENIDALNPGYEGKLGSGRINVYRALTGGLTIITSPASGEFLSGTEVVRGTAAGWNFSRYRLEALRNGSVESTIADSTAAVEDGVLGTWDTTGLNGNYTLRLRVITTDGTSNDASVSVTVDNTSPEAVISSPADGTAVSGLMTISGTAKDANLESYSLEYGPGSTPLTFQNIGAFYSSVESGVLGSWETSGLTGGYTLALSARDRAGNSSRTSVGLTILSAAPTRGLQAQSGLPPTFILPNPFDRTATSETTFVYNLEGNLEARIYLFDLNGGLIWQKSFAAGENGGKAGANNPGWSGANLFGERVPNGVYLYQITADRKVIGRGKIIILN